MRPSAAWLLLVEASVGKTHFRGKGCRFASSLNRIPFTGDQAMTFRFPLSRRKKTSAGHKGRHHKTRRLFLQPLESRTLLAADAFIDASGVLTIRAANPDPGESLNVIVDQSGPEIVVRAKSSLSDPDWQEVKRFNASEAASAKRMLFTGTENGDFFVNNTLLTSVAYGYNGNDQMYGGFGNDAFDGGAGNDLLDGRWADDTYAFIGKSLGSDTINDRTGQNTLDFRWYTQSYGTPDGLVGVQIDLRRSDLQIVSPTGGLNVKLAPGAAHNVVGTRFNDTIRGNDAANRLVGGDGDDHIWGYGEGDHIYGEGGDDFLYGGGGGNRIYGGDGNDTLEAGTGFGDVLYGEAGNDTLIAGYQSALYGYTGDDAYVFRGSDSLGVVTVNDNGGIDTLMFNDFGYGVEVDLAKTIFAVNTDAAVELAPGYFVAPLVVNLAVTNSIENVVGSAFDDVLLGNAADNVLLGGDGIDVLAGRDGNDLLVGYADEDLFVDDAGYENFLVLHRLDQAQRDTLQASLDSQQTDAAGRPVWTTGLASWVMENPDVAFSTGLLEKLLFAGIPKPGTSVGASNPIANLLKGLADQMSANSGHKLPGTGASAPLGALLQQWGTQLSGGQQQSTAPHLPGHQSANNAIANAMRQLANQLSGEQGTNQFGNPLQSSQDPFGEILAQFFPNQFKMPNGGPEATGSMGTSPIAAIVGALGPLGKASCRWRNCWSSRGQRCWVCLRKRHIRPHGRLRQQWLWNERLAS